MTAADPPEFRTDVLTGLKTLVAPVRSSRPSAVHSEPSLQRSDDPFAEGCESETPDERFAVRNESSSPNKPGWKLRVVPNRYPAVVSSSSSLARTGDFNSPLFPAQPAFGEHDVVIECPDPRSRLAELSTEEVQRILVAWRIRIQQLGKAARFSSVAIFRNEGFSGGASLAHCHSQIIASEQLTPLDEERHSRALRHRKDTGRELLIDLLHAERTDGRRMIWETSEFAVLCPFASRTSWHVRFIPLSNANLSFANATDAEISELAGLLKCMLEKIQSELGGSFSFNLTLPHPRLDQPAEFRWMLELMPRTGRAAGWEYLSAVDIVTVAPEYSASRLRSP